MPKAKNARSSYFLALRSLRLSLRPEKATNQSWNAARIHNPIKSLLRLIASSCLFLRLSAGYGSWITPLILVHLHHRIIMSFLPWMPDTSPSARPWEYEQSSHVTFHLFASKRYSYRCHLNPTNLQKWEMIWSQRCLDSKINGIHVTLRIFLEISDKTVTTVRFRLMNKSYFASYNNVSLVLNIITWFRDKILWSTVKKFFERAGRELYSPCIS